MDINGYSYGFFMYLGFAMVKSGFTITWNNIKRYTVD